MEHRGPERVVGQDLCPASPKTLDCVSSEQVRLRIGEGPNLWVASLWAGDSTRLQNIGSFRKHTWARGNNSVSIVNSLVGKRCRQRHHCHDLSNVQQESTKISYSRSCGLHSTLLETAHSEGVGAR